MIQTTAAESAASAALWALNDFCSHCRLAFCSSTPPYLFHSTLFFPFAFHLTKQIIAPPTPSPLCSLLTHSSPAARRCLLLIPTTHDLRGTS